MLYFLFTKSILKNPNNLNPCKNESEKYNLCYCNNRCNSCYNPELHPLYNDVLLHYIPVSSRSKGCNLDFFKPFIDLERIELG